MPVTERVMGLGDWSVRLRPDTPYSLRNSIATPFTQIVITEGRVPASVTTDAIFLGNALYTGVLLRPGPQYELGGASAAWYLGDDKGGAGFSITGRTIAAGTLSSAVSTVLTGTGISSGTIGSGSVSAWVTGSATFRDMLNGLAAQLGFEWRVNPNFTADVNSVTNLYGATPTAVIVRRDGPQEVSTPFGVTGNVASTWDWESYGNRVYLWTNQGRGEASSTGLYRDPLGNIMTITRGYEQPEAPAGTENAIADWWLGQINRAVRTVEVDSTTYAVTGYAPCGGQVFLYDVENGLFDLANQVQYGGGIITPVSARVVSVTWPVERGMGVYVRSHNGTSASYVDLTDWVEWESPGARFEISTAAQQLAPPSTAPLEAMWRPWQTYTPTWDSYGSPTPTVGNGTITGGFRRLGTALEVRVTLTFGSTTNGGAGGWVFYLPTGVVGKTQAGLSQLGKGVVLDTVLGREYPIDVRLESGGSFMTLLIDSPWVNVTATHPHAFTTNDKVNITATFEVAP